MSHVRWLSLLVVLAVAACGERSEAPRAPVSSPDPEPLPIDQRILGRWMSETSGGGWCFAADGTAFHRTGPASHVSIDDWTSPADDPGAHAVRWQSLWAGGDRIAVLLSSLRTAPEVALLTVDGDTLRDDRDEHVRSEPAGEPCGADRMTPLSTERSARLTAALESLPANRSPACVALGTLDTCRGIGASAAPTERAACASHGVWVESGCPRDGAVGRCGLPDGAAVFYYDGPCPAPGCEMQGGTYRGLTEWRSDGCTTPP